MWNKGIPPKTSVPIIVIPFSPSDGNISIVRWSDEHSVWIALRGGWFEDGEFEYWSNLPPYASFDFDAEYQKIREQYL